MNASAPSVLSKELSEVEQLDAVNCDPDAVRHLLDTPFQGVINRSLDRCNTLRFLKRPTRDQIRRAVASCPAALRYAPWCDVDVVRDALRRCPWAIAHVPVEHAKYTELACLAVERGTVFTVNVVKKLNAPIAIRAMELHPGCTAFMRWTTQVPDEVKQWLAYRIWEARGRPSNEALEHWICAEHLLSRRVHEACLFEPNGGAPLHSGVAKLPWCTYPYPYPLTYTS